MRRFKTLSTTRARLITPAQVWQELDGQLWQRNYYEHVIRNDDALDRIREYITNNPTSWALDRENPEHEPVHTLSTLTRVTEPWMV
ncbi:MAG: hypothetical protein M0R22_10415 [Dehalococcoidia bacterium]|jgi:REP element-mobilizing transposase RayT|nr:hypothetical protein [Dehalococcoidia bacterium]